LQAYLIDTQRVAWPDDGSVFVPRAYDPSLDENRPTNATHNGVSWVKTVFPAGAQVDSDGEFPTVDNDGKVTYAGTQILDAQDPCGEAYKPPAPKESELQAAVIGNLG
jgi:hypothetical protein